MIGVLLWLLIVGANKESVEAARVDLSDTVVVDLDLKLVKEPSSDSSFVGAPVALINQLHSKISQILMTPYSHWVSRSSALNPELDHPHCAVKQGDMAREVIRTFVVQVSQP